MCVCVCVCVTHIIIIKTLKVIGYCFWHEMKNEVIAIFGNINIQCRFIFQFELVSMFYNILFYFSNKKTYLCVNIMTRQT